jgi:hypothetical protein
MKKMTLKIIPLLLVLFSATQAQADGSNRLSGGLGVVHIDQPSKTYITLGAEFEHRMNPLFGLGGMFNYFFSDPSIVQIGAPEVFFHPLGGDFFISATPLFEFAGGSTNVGSRFGTRIPLPIGPMLLVPTAAVTFINGTKYYFFGMGISI